MEKQKKQKIIKIMSAISGVLFLFVFTIFINNFVVKTSRDIIRLSLVKRLQAEFVDFFYRYNKFPNHLIANNSSSPNMIDCNNNLCLEASFINNLNNMGIKYTACVDDTLVDCGGDYNYAQSFKITFDSETNIGELGLGRHYYSKAGIY